MKINQQALQQQVKSTFELIDKDNKSTLLPTSFTPEQIKIIALGLLLDKSPKEILENIKTKNTIEDLLTGKTCAEDNLKSRYRALSLLFHPDKINWQINMIETIIKKYSKDILFQSLQLVHDRLTSKQKTPLSKPIKTFEPFFDAFSATEICEILGGASMPNFEHNTGREILSLIVTIQRQEEQLANANLKKLPWQASNEYLNLLKLLIQYSFTASRAELTYGEKASYAGQVVSIATYITLINTSPLGVISNITLFGSIGIMLMTKCIKGLCNFLDQYYPPSIGIFKNMLDVTYTHVASVDHLAFIACIKQLQLMIKIQIRSLEACSPGFELVQNTPAFLNHLKWPNLGFNTPSPKTTAASEPFLLIEWPQHAQPFEHELKENEELDALEITPVPLEDGWEKIPFSNKKAI